MTDELLKAIKELLAAISGLTHGDMPPNTAARLALYTAPVNAALAATKYRSYPTEDEMRRAVAAPVPDVAGDKEPKE